MTSRTAELSRLLEGAAELGNPLAHEAAATLIDYLDEVYSNWNQSAGLTTIPRGDAVRLHLLDALTAIPLLPSVGTIADVGSGAGVPGIPLAITLPAARIVLIESRRRKCAFLEHVVRRLGLSHCEVREADAWRVSAESEEGFDVVISRAFAKTEKFLELAAGLVRPGGSIVVMAGRWHTSMAGESVRSMQRLYRDLERRVVLPSGREERLLVRYVIGK